MVQIVWRGNTMDSSGYAKATREYVLALHAHGVDVKLEPIAQPLPQVDLMPEHRAVLQHLIAKAKTRYHKVHIIHHPPDIWKRKLSRSIGFTYWETSKVPERWVQLSHQMHAVFLPSSHNLDIFRQSGIRVPLFHIRPCVHPSAYNSVSEQTLPYLNQLPPFRFLSVFSWIPRKGYDLLLRAFWEEFAAGDNVALVIKTAGMNPAELENWKRSFGISHPTAPVYVDQQTRSEAEMDALYRGCQAFVLPSRGEGVGYPYLEAAIRGLPVIATGWGGHMDFLNDQNSYPLSYQLVPVPPQNYYYGYQSDQSWAEVSVEHMRSVMRRVYMNYAEAKSKGTAAQQYVQQHCSPTEAVQDIVTAIRHMSG